MTKPRMLDPAALLHAAGVVAGVAETERVRVALVGGLAMQYYGSPRLTGDLDVVAEDPLTSFRGKKLSFGGIRTKVFAVPTDLIVRSDRWRSLYGDAVDKARRPVGMPIRVVLPEHLAAMKIVAARSKDELDLEYLIVSKKLDLDKARIVIERFLGAYAVEEFDRTVEVAKWKKKRGMLE